MAGGTAVLIAGGTLRDRLPKVFPRLRRDRLRGVRPAGGFHRFLSLEESLLHRLLLFLEMDGGVNAVAEIQAPRAIRLFCPLVAVGAEAFPEEPAHQAVDGVGDRSDESHDSAFPRGRQRWQAGRQGRCLWMRPGHGQQFGTGSGAGRRVSVATVTRRPEP